MAGIYENLGVRFMYPENWQVAHEQASHEPYEISLETPKGAFWSLNIYESSTDPVELAAESLRTMQDEYEDLESEPKDEEIESVSTVGFEMNFYCLDLVVSARVVAFRQDDRTCLVLYQAETKEFDELDKVFQAILLSLIRTDV